jgi:hypothetical protein
MHASAQQKGRDLHPRQPTWSHAMRHKVSEETRKTRINRSMFKRRPPAYSRVSVSASDELVRNFFGLNEWLLEATEIKSRVGSNSKFENGDVFMLTQLCG